MFKVDGLKDVQDYLTQISDGLTLEGMTKYSNIIVKNIMISCDMDKEDVRIIPKESSGNITFDINVRNLKDMECFKRAFIQVTDKMPIGVKDIFMKILETIEKKKNETS